MAILPRYLRMRQRDWKDPFSWFNWMMMKKAEVPVLYQFQGGVDPRYGLSSFPAGTFTRADASTCATYIDGNGIVQTVAANIPRYQHVDPSNPSLGQLLLLEGSRTNISSYSSDCGAAGVNWALTNVSAAMNATGPDGIANSAATVTNTAASGYGGPVALAGYSAGTGPHSVTRWIKRGDSDWVWVGESQDAVWHRCSFDMSGGGCAKGTEVNCTGTVLTAGANGWYRVQITYSSTNAYTPRAVSGVASGTASFGGLGVGNYHYCYGAQVEKLAAFASSYIPTTTAAVTRAADSLSFGFLPVPQAMTVYADCLGVSPSTAANNTIVTIGDVALADRFAIVRFDSSSVGRVRGGQRNGTTTVLSDSASTAVFGDRVESLLQIAADGSVTTTSVKNGGSSVVGTTSAANALSAAWAAQTLTLTNEPPYHGIRSIKIASGVRSLDTMRSL